MTSDSPGSTSGRGDERPSSDPPGRRRPLSSTGVTITNRATSRKTEIHMRKTAPSAAYYSRYEPLF
ncbi:hypothetical protein GCM10009678_87780 [Actinomadura kijaniata]